MKLIQIGWPLLLALLAWAGLTWWLVTAQHWDIWEAFMAVALGIGSVGLVVVLWMQSRPSYEAERPK